MQNQFAGSCHLLDRVAMPERPARLVVMAKHRQGLDLHLYKFLRDVQLVDQDDNFDVHVFKTKGTDMEKFGFIKWPIEHKLTFVYMPECGTQNARRVKGRIREVLQSCPIQLQKNNQVQNDVFRLACSTARQDLDMIAVDMIAASERSDVLVGASGAALPESTSSSRPSTPDQEEAHGEHGESDSLTSSPSRGSLIFPPTESSDSQPSISSEGYSTSSSDRLMADDHATMRRNHFLLSVAEKTSPNHLELSRPSQCLQRAQSWPRRVPSLSFRDVKLSTAIKSDTAIDRLNRIRQFWETEAGESKFGAFHICALGFTGDPKVQNCSSDSMMSSESNGEVLVADSCDIEVL